MVLAALFTISKIWKQPKWIKTLWCIYTIEYYLAIKKEKILPFVTAWMDLESNTPSEISQSEKDKGMDRWNRLTAVRGERVERLHERRRRD